MKNWITGLFASLLVLALVGCGQQLSSAEPELILPQPGLVSSEPGLEAQRSGIEWLISLAPGPGFTGVKAKARYRDRSGQRDFRVEVENLGRLAGQQVAVCVNNALVGTASVSALGTARLNRETQLGQSVPVVVSGTAVKVASGTTCAGATIALGTF